MRVVILAVGFVGWGLTGCGHDKRGNHSEARWEIAPEALDGCRAPTTPECVVCCQGELDDGNCHWYDGDEDWEALSVEPWYNGGFTTEGRCPLDCERCAQCSIRNEQELRALDDGDGHKCDCTTVEIGVDPCFTASREINCECYCQTALHLEARCPKSGE